MSLDSKHIDGLMNNYRDASRLFELKLMNNWWTIDEKQSTLSKIIRSISIPLL